MRLKLIMLKSKDDIGYLAVDTMQVLKNFNGNYFIDNGCSFRISFLRQLSLYQSSVNITDLITRSSLSD